MHLLGLTTKLIKSACNRSQVSEEVSKQAISKRSTVKQNVKLEKEKKNERDREH